MKCILFYPVLYSFVTATGGCQPECSTQVATSACSPGRRGVHAERAYAGAAGCGGSAGARV